MYFVPLLILHIIFQVPNLCIIQSFKSRLEILIGFFLHGCYKLSFRIWQEWEREPTATSSTPSIRSLSHHSVGVCWWTCWWTSNWVQIRLDTELDLSMGKVFPVSTHHPPLFGVYWWWLSGSLWPCVNQLGDSSFSSKNKTNSCRFSAGGRAQLSPDWPNGLFLGKLSFSVEAEEARLPISTLECCEDCNEGKLWQCTK
jgi:hypothetical protein